MNNFRIDRGGSDYPAVLLKRLGVAAPPLIHAMGDLSILRHRRVAQCPGTVIIKTYDAIRELGDAGVVGGFHSPMERECLDLRLRGTQPVILCAARKLEGLRLGKEARRGIRNGRVLVLSPSADDTKKNHVHRRHHP